MSDKATLSAKCKNCGSDKFNIPSDPKPDDMVTCAGCGAVGRYGDIRETMTKEGKKLVEKAITDAFSKAGFKTK